MNRILIVEDETRIAAFVEKGLKANGFVTTHAATGSEALNIARSDDFDLMILDVKLPDMSGLDVLEQVRGCGDPLPVIILSAYDRIDQKIAGLESGANDYITKPFRFEELLVRIKVQLRDRAKYSANVESTVVRVGDVQLDLISRQITIADRQLDLSLRELSLAEVLMRHAGQVMSRQQILDRVWGYDFDPGSNVVDVHVRNLRKKLGCSRIETVRGLGYRFKT